MKGLQKLQLKVPQDASLTAFGYSEWAQYFEPKLTALKEPCREIGKQAYELLKHRIQDYERPIQQIRLMPKFEIRESCSPPALGHHPVQSV